MNAKEKLKGVFIPVTTPFLANGDVDYEGLASNVKRYAGTGIHGYLALGSNGENKSLLFDEKIRVLETILENRGETQCVMTGCIAESTRETLLLAKEAARAGSDFATLLPPCYFASAMTDDVLYHYFCSVADAAEIPCMLYCAPQYSANVLLSPALVERAADHGNIVGLKDSSKGNIDKYLAVVPPDFAVMAGSISSFLPALKKGAVGGVVSLANAFPDLIVRLYERFLSGDVEGSDRMSDDLIALNKLVSGKGGVASVKAAATMNGFAGGIPREPLLPLTASAWEELRAALCERGLI